jgi:xanthine dehydrogenase accessory factor
MMVGMYEIATPVARWLADGRTVHVAQIVATRGFSSREPGAALAWTDTGERTGGLLPALDAALTGTPDPGALVDLAVTDDDALAAGLSCGGTATVLVSDAAGYPDGTWDDLGRREPLCLVSVLSAAAPVRTEVFTRRTVRDAVQIPGASGAPRLFARGTSGTALCREGDSTVVIRTLWPTTTLVVVGDGNIADALAGQADLLGWTSLITNDPAAAAEAAAILTETDAAVVLSHDRDVDVPALAALLAGRAGYVGALGSRGTQAARREGLLGRGVAADVLERIHGPAGLDIDAHTPAEIAVSITAEILASRSGSSGGSIRERSGPVHTAGVAAPPQRY